MGKILHYSVTLQVWQALVLWCYCAAIDAINNWIKYKLSSKKRFFSDGSPVNGEGILAEFLSACFMSPFIIFVLWIVIIVLFN